MKDFLEQHRIRLTVRGPVFVGSGREITKKEYISLSDSLSSSQQVGILDIGRLYRTVQRKDKAKSFEQFMMGNSGDIGRWLEKERLWDEARNNCISYVLDMGSTALESGKRTQIMACIKDPYGNPYVPGSSLKGMLRTILAAEKLERDASLRKCAAGKLERGIPQKQGRRYYLSRTCSEIEVELFRTLRRPNTRAQDAVNDILSGFVVSDSEPIERKQLVLAQKVERRTDGKERTLNLLRECLAPGTEIRFTVTVDRSIWPDMTKERLLRAVEHFDELYNECFLQAFSGMDRLLPPQVFVGGGTGFVSKTLVYPILGKAQGLPSVVRIFENTGVPRIHKHHLDQRAGASPHILKCTWHQGRTVQMGLCDMAIEP